MYFFCILNNLYDYLPPQFPQFYIHIIFYIHHSFQWDFTSGVNLMAFFKYKWLIHDMI